MGLWSQDGAGQQRFFFKPLAARPFQPGRARRFEVGNAKGGGKAKVEVAV